MKEELQTQLETRYPLIFSQRCEISCGDGWFNLVNTLCHTIQGHIDSRARQRDWAIKQNERREQRIAAGETAVQAEYDIPEVVEQAIAQQIKEKFGTLRFYITGGDDYIHGAINLADHLSETICEECGNVGQRRNGSWIRTLCDDHHVAKSLGAHSGFLNKIDNQ